MAAFRRALEARFSGDVDTVRSLHSQSEFTMIIGTDEAERYHAPDEVIGIWGIHKSERPAFEYEFTRLEGYESGDVG